VVMRVLGVPISILSTGCFAFARERSVKTTMGCNPGYFAALAKSHVDRRSSMPPPSSEAPAAKPDLLIIILVAMFAITALGLMGIVAFALMGF
jgi:hypothetical protein